MRSIISQTTFSCNQTLISNHSADYDNDTSLDLLISRWLKTGSVVYEKLYIIGLSLFFAIRNQLIAQCIFSF